MKRDWLYLPIELKVRDLHSRILLACFAALRGIKSIVGHKLEVQHKIRECPPGFFLMYGFVDSYLNNYEKIIKYGHKVVAQDDEGLVVWQNDMYQKFRVSSSVLEKVSQVYAWGQNQKQLIDNWSPKTKEKILITGSPRFDLLRKPFNQALDVDAQNIRKKIGPYILINTNFGRANHFKGTQYYIQTKREQYVTDNISSNFFEGCLEFQKYIYYSYIEMVFELSSKFPETIIVIRPHPSENHDAWRKHVLGLSNVKVIHDGCVLPWILGSEVLIHNGCTTGVEAYMLNKPVIAYRPVINETYEPVLPNQLSHQTFSKNELIKVVKSYLACSKALRTPEMEKIANFYIESIGNSFASEKILDKLCDNLEQITIDEKRESHIYNHLISNSSQAFNSKSMLSNEYIRHKFNGLSINEVRDSLHRLKKAYSPFSKVNVKQIGETCFLFACGGQNKKITPADNDFSLVDNKNRLSRDSYIFSDANHQVFFGYYDITPFSPDESKLLAMHAPLENVTPAPNSQVKVGYYDLNQQAPEFQAVDISSTWCWQMGCRLQWYPAAGENAILYNRLVNGKYGSVIQDISTKNILKAYSYPMYAVSPDGRWGLSINFSRLQKLRPGYGYATLPDKTQSDLAPIRDGIWRIEMETGRAKFLLSLRRVKDIKPHKSMEAAEHYFNHLLFNPSSTRFLFMHLWVKDGKRYSRLLTADCDGSNIHVVNNEGVSSHYTWKNDDFILVYSFHKENGFNYYLYQDKSSERMIVGKDILKEDGHPTFIPSSNDLITDTYPNINRIQSLIYYHFKSNNYSVIHSSYVPDSFKGEIRCDFHPRLSNSGSFVCIDELIDFRRTMKIIDISRLHVDNKSINDSMINDNSTINSQYCSNRIDRQFRLARIWSNKELLKISSLFSGEIVNISGWKDEDKEGKKYKDYFTNADRYWITNFSGYRGIQNVDNEIFLDLAADLPSDLNKKFDVCFNHTTLEHIFDFRKAFKNICEMSKDIVIVVVPFSQVEHESDSYNDFWRFTPSSMRKLFFENSLTVIYESWNNDFNSATYLFFVGSRFPDNWKGMIKSCKPVNPAGNWIGMIEHE